MWLLKLIKHYSLKFFLILSGFFLLAVPLAWLQLQQPKALHTLQIIVTQQRLFFTGCRWLMLALLVDFWPKTIDHLARRQQWTPEKTAFWLAQRWHIAGWLVVLEIILGQNLLSRLLAAL